MNSNTQPVPAELALQLVADPRRRTVLRHLHENGEEAVPVDELVDAVDGTDAGDGADRVDAEQVRLRMHHVHLPKLADADIVDYDTQRATVRYRSQDRIEETLRFVTDRLQ